MRDSVPSARYSPVCNVLRQWKTSLIPTIDIIIVRASFRKCTAFPFLRRCISIIINRHARGIHSKFKGALQYHPVQELFPVLVWEICGNLTGDGMGQSSKPSQHLTPLALNLRVRISVCNCLVIPGFVAQQPCS